TARKGMNHAPTVPKTAMKPTMREPERRLPAAIDVVAGDNRSCPTNNAPNANTPTTYKLYRAGPNRPVTGSSKSRSKNKPTHGKITIATGREKLIGSPFEVISSNVCRLRRFCGAAKPV